MADDINWIGLGEAALYNASVRILIIEDEKKTASYLQKGLIENGFGVDVAEQGEQGLQMASSRQYDLIILDVMLPERDGWSVLEELRSAGSRRRCCS